MKKYENPHFAIISYFDEDDSAISKNLHGMDKLNVRCSREVEFLEAVHDLLLKAESSHEIN